MMQKQKWNKCVLEVPIRECQHMTQWLYENLSQLMHINSHVLVGKQVLKCH